MSLFGTSTNTPSTIRDFLNAGMAVTSFDIETTGVVGQDFRVTQMGFTTDVITPQGPFNRVSIERAIIGSYRERGSVADLLEEELEWMRAYNSNLKPGTYPLTPEHLLKIPNEEVLLEAHKYAGAADFGKQQYDTGALKTVVQAFRDNVEVNSRGELVFKEGVSTVFQTVDTLKATLENNNGILLIQNANFEDKVHQDLIKNSRGDQGGLPRAFVGEFNRSVYGTVGTSTLFSIPNEVRRERDNVRESIRKLKDSHKMGVETQEALKDVLEARAQMQRVMTKKVEQAVANGRSVVLDLMDFTDIFQMTLLDKNVEALVAKELPGFTMNPLLLQRGRSVELLAKTLLQEKETHTALSDAKQQTAIFNKMIQMTDELEKGIVSDDTLAYIKVLNDPKTGELDFVKTLHSRLTDIQIGAGAIKDVSERNKFVVDKIRKLVQDVKKTYDGLPEGSNFRRGDILSILENHFLSKPKTNDPFEKIAPLSDKESVSTNSGSSQSLSQTGQETVNQNTPKTNNESLPNANTKSISESKFQRLNDTIASVHALQQRLKEPGLLKNMKPPSQVAKEAASTVDPGNLPGSDIPRVAKYGFMALGAAALVNLMLSDGRKRDREHKEHFRNDTYDALYDNLYVGQAYADWKERNNSHRVLY